MLWIGQLLSDTGSEIGMLAHPLLVLALTHSAVLAGVVGTLRAITRLCLQLPAGALADRLDRRLTMIICDTMRAVLLALLGILIVLHLASWPVVLIVSVTGAADRWTPRPARVRRLGNGRIRRHDGHGGGAVPDPAGFAAGGVPSGRAQLTSDTAPGRTSLLASSLQNSLLTAGLREPHGHTKSCGRLMATGERLLTRTGAVPARQAAAGSRSTAFAG